MSESEKPRYFSGWWASLFTLLSLQLFPLPFAFLINFLGDWVFQNPVTVDMSYFGSVSMHPIADNLISIFSMTGLIIFILWRMNIRKIPFSDIGAIYFNPRAFYLSLFILAIFIALQEIYMLILDIEIPEGFIEFMLSDPILLSLISVTIIAPIAEEFIFRGFLYSQLSRTKLGPWGSVSLISFFWTIIHFQYEIKILVVLFLFGLFLGYLRIAYKSLGLPIMVHAINNLFAFGMAFYFS